MGKEYTKAQVEAAFKKAGIKFSDKTNEDIGVNIARQILNDPMYTHDNDVADALKRGLRIEEQDASRIIDNIKGRHGSGLNISQQFANAATGFFNALTPSPSPPAGTCADVRRDAAGGGLVNQVAAKYCNIGMN